MECSVELCRRRLRFPRRYGGIYGNRGVRGQLNQQQHVCLCVCGLCAFTPVRCLSAVYCPLSPSAVLPVVLVPLVVPVSDYR